MALICPILCRAKPASSRDHGGSVTKVLQIGPVARGGASIAAVFAFTPQTQTFLRDLSTHNEREWLDAHRARYQAAYVVAAKAFVAAAAPELERIAPGVHAEPRVLGSIFRLNRDIRFSRDKRPYKEHLDLWFWEGERRTAQSGFYLRVTPELVAIGAGANHLSREAVDRYRAAVCDADAGPELVQIVSALETEGWELGEPRLKRPPRDWDPVDPDAAPLLRRDSLFVARREPAELAVDAQRLLPTCVEVWTRLAPLHRWLVAHVQ
jgi:uncharacterized protein (TIGR02453 family)